MMRSVLCALLSLLVSVNVLSAEHFDVLIRNGKIIDGSGNPWFLADVGINGDRIDSIGHLDDATADREIDARGLVISPGFIDPHTHALRGIYDVPTAESSLLQGVTTLVEGNDGSSPFPISDHLSKIEETEISPNWAVFVGQGTIRRLVVGDEDRAASDAELNRMKQMVSDSMAQGALGLSTGLFYVPGSFTPIEEVIELSKVAASYHGIYISHLRDETTALLDSVQETITIAEEAGIPVQVTHHKAMGKDAWGSSEDSLRMIDEARARGVDITMDQYPYTASQTGITAVVPQWAQEGGRDRMIQRMQNSETRQTVKDGIIYRLQHERGGGDPANVFISANSWDKSMEGKNLAEITRSRGLEPSLANAAEVVMDIVIKGGARAVYHAMAEEDVERIMQHPATAIGSDGPLSVFGEGAPHPRQYGTFARVLGYYVRERGVLKLEDAIRKMTSLTAQRLSIQDRGLLREGYLADITIFNQNTITDMATFENPHQYAVGVNFVLVNGTLVVEQGKHTGARPGRIIYGPGYTSN